MLGLHCCAGFSVVCSEQGLLSSRGAQASPRGGSCSAARAPGCGPQTLRLRAPEHRLSTWGAGAQFLYGTWDLPGSGIELVSPALAGRLFTTEPPEKPRLYCNFLKVYLLSLCLLLLPSHMGRSREDGTFKEPDTKPVAAACSFYFNCQTTLWFLS